MAKKLGGYPDATAATCTGADRYGLDLKVEHATRGGLHPRRVRGTDRLATTIYARPQSNWRARARIGE